MRGGARWWIFIGLLCSVDYINGYALKCDRIPDGAGATKSPADGRFRIRIEGNPERYKPNEVYNISIVSMRSIHSPHKFTGFMMEVANDGGGRSDTVGVFQLMGDTLVKFSERCPNLVTHTSAIPKTDIQVRWTSPPAGSGCIVFRATVIEHRDVWYMDDGPLSKMFCEEEQDSIDLQPRINKDCCACQEAKYELTFEGLWSRHTHPKDYPSNRWLTRFSDIIGASHTVDYRYWEYGQQASEGLQQVAEHGSTRQLESELKSQSNQIRTIIKARGIAYPNVTGKTFAVFRVDSQHHLVSIVSQIDPSPDWIVGVSGLELCEANCTWVEQKMLNLYPWDAGTDSGPSYTSPDQPTHPKDLIRRIKSDFPNDPRSPFYDPNAQDMKPMARIYFTRQRLYDKNCENREFEDERTSRSDACRTNQWSEWGPCSSTCGAGEQHRHRNYLDRHANHDSCTNSLTERKKCHGDCRSNAHNRGDDPFQNEIEPECALTEWSEWSSCSSLCGNGFRVRSREYKMRNARKRCEHAVINAPPLEQREACMGTECGGDITEGPDGDDRNDRNDRNRDTEYEEEPHYPRHRPTDSACKWSEWSTFTPCNRNCRDNGKRMSYRFPINRNLDVVDIQMRATDVMHNYGVTFDVNDSNEDSRVPQRKELHMPLAPNGRPYQFMSGGCAQLFCFADDDPCSYEQFENVVECDDRKTPSCDVIPPECFLDPVAGHCRDPKNMWYYDKRENRCGLFSYSGCDRGEPGVKNRFTSLADCQDKCMYLLHSKNETSSFESMRSFDQIRHPQDCVVSQWDRGHCNATCGEGMRRKVRRIITPPMNGGRSCPKKLTKMERCRLPPCEISRYDTNPSWGPGRNSW